METGVGGWMVRVGLGTVSEAKLEVWIDEKRMKKKLVTTIIIVTTCKSYIL